MRERERDACKDEQRMEEHKFGWLIVSGVKQWRRRKRMEADESSRQRGSETERFVRVSREGQSRAIIGRRQVLNKLACVGSRGRERERERERESSCL